MTRLFGIDSWLQSCIIKLLKDIFVNINKTTVEIGAELGKSPQSFNYQIYNSLKNFSDNVVLPLAIYILAIIITLNLIRTILDDFKRQNPVKVLVMFTVTTVISIMVVRNSFEIIEFILNLAQGVVESSLKLFDGNNDTTLSADFQQFEETLKTLESGSLFAILLVLVLTFIISWIIRVLVQVVILGRFIEIFIRIAISPIPFAMFFNREFSSSGYNYVKSMGAVSLQSVLIIAVIAMYRGMISSIIVSVRTEDQLNLFLVKVLGINITLIFMLFNTKRIADSILGAH